MQIEGITLSITGANRPTRAKLMAGQARDGAPKPPGTPITTGLLIPNVCGLLGQPLFGRKHQLSTRCVCKKRALNL
jgi:hypothetical protein